MFTFYYYTTIWRYHRNTIIVYACCDMKLFRAHMLIGFLFDIKTHIKKKRYLYYANTNWWKTTGIWVQKQFMNSKLWETRMFMSTWYCYMHSFIWIVWCSILERISRKNLELIVYQIHISVDIFIETSSNTAYYRIWIKLFISLESS